MSNRNALWVSINAWRLLPPQTTSSSEDGASVPIDLYQRYLDEAVPLIALHLQDKGLISSWAVRTAADQFTYIGVYTSEEAMHEMWAVSRSIDELRELFDAYVEPVRHEEGPLTDIFHIGSRWQFVEPDPAV
jgi:hypothetical protein